MNIPAVNDPTSSLLFQAHLGGLIAPLDSGSTSGDVAITEDTFSSRVAEVNAATPAGAFTNGEASKSSVLQTDVVELDSLLVQGYPGIAIADTYNGVYSLQSVTKPTARIGSVLDLQG